MDMKLELVTVPVSDVDRAKAFYVDQVGFNADHDLKALLGSRGHLGDAGSQHDRAG